jgi:hypothetical protein
MSYDENESNENGSLDYNFQSYSLIDNDFSELRNSFREQQESSNNISGFIFENIDRNYIFIQKRPFQSLKKTRRKIEYKGTSYEYEYDSNQYRHCNLSNDNIAKKIESHYLKFLIRFLNVILKKLNCKQKFCGFSKKSKIFSNASKANIKAINIKTIKEIFDLEITKRQKKIYEEDIYKNKSIYEEVLTKFPQMKVLFEKKLIDIFNEIYYDENHRNLKLIDLNKYNINLIIDLKKEKLENFEDLLNKKKEESEKKKEVVKSDYFKYNKY